MASVTASVQVPSYAVNLDRFPGSICQADILVRVDWLTQMYAPLRANVSRKSRPLVRDSRGACWTAFPARPRHESPVPIAYLRVGRVGHVRSPAFDDVGRGPECGTIDSGHNLGDLRARP